ncbi:phage/plasmid primase, P4 family [Streptomyces scabiei]|uniref:phage/plasmid primase, P4 family n=1 Tax=Streptomyces scabiei TaxID=1930 RepID=UPI0029A820AF|nr:phage/plasmid primase, P4 family [Streptomyces scabiei]MDX3522057.1 phage/plasmid primase, P4 family [Streptomyces scabiei]
MAIRSRSSVPGNAPKGLAPGITKVGNGKEQIEVWVDAEGAPIGAKKRYRKANGDKGMWTASSERKPDQLPHQFTQPQRMAKQHPEVDYVTNKDQLREVFWQHDKVIDAEAAYVVVPCEGESDGEFLTEASRAGSYGVPTGLLGTTTWSSSTWDPAHTKVAQQLKAEGRLGPFICDNDPTGHKYAKMRQAAVPGHPVLMPPTEGHDLKDHFENGGTWDSLVEFTPEAMAEVAAKSESDQKLKRRMEKVHRRMVDLISAAFPDWFPSLDCPPGQYEGPCWLCEGSRQLRYTVEEHKDIRGGAQVKLWCHKCQAEYGELLPPIAATMDDLKDCPKVSLEFKTVRAAAGSEVGVLDGVNVVPDVFSDSDNGRILAEILAGKVVWIEKEQDFYAYNGHGWERDYSGIVSRKARDMAQQQFDAGRIICKKAVGDSDEAKAEREYGKLLMSHGASGLSVAGRRRTLEAFRNHEGVTLKSLQHGFDQNPRLIACLDKAVILLDHAPFFEVRELRPDDYTTMNTGVAIREDAQHNTLDEMLAKFWPIPEVRRYLIRLLGYSILGGNPERQLCVLCGETTGGKTTLMEAVDSALGSYSASYGQSIFHANAKDKPRPDLIRLLPKRYGHSSEANNKWTLHGDQVKRMVGEDSMSLRDMYGKANEIIQATPQMTPWLATNHAPQIKDMDAATTRRVTVIPCDVSLSKAEEDPTIRSRMRTEKAILEALLWMLLAGWVDYRQNGLEDRPAPVASATQKFLRDASEAGDYWDSQVVQKEGSELLLSEVYAKYRTWCYNNEVLTRDILKERAFAMQMSAVWSGVDGVTKDSDRKEKGKRIGVIYIGLALVEDEEKETN